MLGNYTDILIYRLEGTATNTGNAVIDFEITYTATAFFRAFAMMTLGIALYKLGFVQGKLRLTSYRKICMGCLAVGLPIVIFGLIQAYSHNFSMTNYFSIFGTLVLNTLGAVWLVIAYLAAINWWCKGNTYLAFQHAIADVGRMALSNYLLQSLIGTSIFYGYGLGLYGQMQRWQLVLIMLMIWVVQIKLSQWWLQRFTQGPCEYLWRSLIYFKLPPLVKR